MKVLFRVLGAAAAVAATGAAILALDKLLTRKKDPLQVEAVEFPDEAETDPAEAEKTAAAYAEGEAAPAEEFYIQMMKTLTVSSYSQTIHKN